MEQTCNLCGSKHSEHLHRISRFKKSFAVHRCTDCGLIFMKPMPTDRQIAEMYSREYFEGSGRSGAFTYTDERKNRRGYLAVNRARIKKISRYAPPPGEFLDVGASFGALLDAAAESGYRTTGMDLSHYAIEHLKTSPHTALYGSPGEAELPEKHYRAVTMIEVIEHLKDPAKALLNIRSAMQDDGVLVIQTANMDGRQAQKAGGDYHYYLPGHLHYFSRNTLSELLCSCGFDVLKVYYPCEFGLLPKLRKSRGDFHSLKDYLRWFKTAAYHLRSKIHFRDFALTSGMVVYAKPSVGNDIRPFAVRDRL